MTSSVLFYLLLFYKLSSLSWAFNNAPPNVGIPLSTTSAERMPFEGGTSEKVQLKRRHLRVVVQFLQTAVTWTVCNSDADDLLSAMTHNPEAVHASSDTDELLFGSVATKPTIHQQLHRAAKFFYDVVCAFVIHDLNGLLARHMRKASRGFLDGAE